MESPEKMDPMYSRFRRAIFSSEIPLGHSASQAPMFVQLPNPSLSCCITIFTARIFLSGSPCGSRARWLTLADRNNIAEVLGQAATHAPQPIQAAAAKDSSALCFSIGIAFASTALPVFTDMYPPAWIMRSKDVRSVTKSLITGNELARQGSTTIVSPSLYSLMWSWQVVVWCQGPCARPLMNMEQVPQIPSRQSWSNAMGSLPSAMSCSLSTSNISRKDISEEMPFT